MKVKYMAALAAASVFGVTALTSCAPETEVETEPTADEVAPDTTAPVAEPEAVEPEAEPCAADPCAAGAEKSE